MSADISLETLRRHWWVAGTSAELARRPIARTVLGTPLALFRTAGKAAALLDRCPHRNAPLSHGKIVEGLIECPYHGWAFDGAGECRRIPGMPGACEHRHQHATAVGVAERDGLVWVRLGEGDAELPPRRHVAPDDARYDTMLWPATVDCALIDGMENLLDACHPHFAHAGLVRRAAKRRTVEVTVRRTAEMAEAVYREDGVPDGLIPRLLEGARATSIGRFFPPGTAQLEHAGPKGTQFLLTAHFTPCDERRVLIHSFISTPRKLAPAWLKRIALRVVFGRVLKQDQTVLRMQQANIDRFGGAEFTSTPLDVMRPHILYFLRRSGENSPPAAHYEATLTMEL